MEDASEGRGVPRALSVRGSERRESHSRDTTDSEAITITTDTQPLCPGLLLLALPTWFPRSQARESLRLRAPIQKLKDSIAKCTELQGMFYFDHPQEFWEVKERLSYFEVGGGCTHCAWLGCRWMRGRVREGSRFTHAQPKSETCTAYCLSPSYTHFMRGACLNSDLLMSPSARPPPILFS